MDWLDLVNLCDSAPYRAETDPTWSAGGFYRFQAHDGVMLGRMLPRVAQALADYDIFIVDEGARIVRVGEYRSTEDLTEAINVVCENLREKGTFREVTDGWRNEKYAVYHREASTDIGGVYFLIERSCSGLFGVVTYGVHINGYVPAVRPEDYVLWVARRSFDKPTWPGYLDNTVAGGLGYPHSPDATCVKECIEEANLSEKVVTNGLRAAGVITYEFLAPVELGGPGMLATPEVQYVYDLPLGEGVKPSPNDGEVEEFMALSVKEVQRRMRKGEFKYNCALCLIDFFIRHGILTPDHTEHYLEIIQRCHRVHPYPLRP